LKCCSTPAGRNTTREDFDGPASFCGHKTVRKAIKEAQKKLGMNDAVITAEGQLNGRPWWFARMEFGFIGAQWRGGRRKVTRGIELSLSTRQPFNRLSCFRRRAHDGRYHQFDAARESFRRARESSNAKLPYISILTDPTTGGVTASSPCSAI